jgi:hypothetical protein
MAFRQKIGKKKKKKKKEEEEDDEKRVLAFVGHPQWRKMNIYIYIRVLAIGGGSATPGQLI